MLRSSTAALPKPQEEIDAIVITQLALFCRRFYLSRLVQGILSSLCLTTFLVGCSGGPSRVLPPDIDAGSAGQQAMATYDTDGDGFVAGEELEKAPGLKAAMATLDTNKDGKVDQGEVSERVKIWQATRIGVSPIMCKVMMDGHPLEGATVTFDPEDFLGNDIKSATGVSGALGEFYPSISPPDSKDRSAPFGVQFGLYKVRVSKKKDGQELIPERYNSKTILGQEVSNDDPAMRRHKVVFKVQGK